MTRTTQTGGRRRWSMKVLVGSATLGLVALGTGISLAATQNDKGAGAVTCIVQADAKAAADANSALSDIFAPGTKLHFSSGGRTVDVTVSAPLTAAAAPAATTPAGNGNAKGNGKGNGAKAGKNNNKNKNNNKKNKNKKHHRNHKKAAATTKAAATKAATTKAVTTKAAPVVKAGGANDGIDPNTVCANLSKDAFNSLGNVVGGNNVGAFIATMAPVTDGGKATRRG